MQKRRHLETSFQQTDPCCTSDAQPHAFLLSGPASPGTPSGTSSPLKKEQPLFTLRQVGMICERLLKEREEKVREEYEEILNTKLAEQYDAFVKFTHDQIMWRYGEQPASYVSWITFSAFMGCLVPCWVVARGPNYDMQQCQYPSVNTGYFKLSSVATTLRQQPDLEISLMSIPPGCGPLLPVLMPVASFAVSLQFGFY